MEENKDKIKVEKRRKLDFNDGDKTVNWLDKIVNLIDAHGMTKLIQAFIVILMMIISIMLFNAVDNVNVIERLIDRQTEQHQIGSNIRLEISPKINRTLTKMLYEMKADRVSILEMHNGKENSTDLPFIFCDMTYEEVKDGVSYVSEGYVDMNMSKFSFPSYVYKNKFFIGTLNEMKEIDKRFALRLDLSETQYIGIILVRTSVDIGFLIVSFKNTPELTKDEIYSSLVYYVQEIGTYLDYNEQWMIRKQEYGNKH